MKRVARSNNEELLDRWTLAVELLVGVPSWADAGTAQTHETASAKAARRAAATNLARAKARIRKTPRSARIRSKSTAKINNSRPKRKQGSSVCDAETTGGLRKPQLPAQ